MTDRRTARLYTPAGHHDSLPILLDYYISACLPSSYFLQFKIESPLQRKDSNMEHSRWKKRRKMKKSATAETTANHATDTFHWRQRHLYYGHQNITARRKGRDETKTNIRIASWVVSSCWQTLIYHLPLFDFLFFSFTWKGQAIDYKRIRNPCCCQRPLAAKKPQP